MSKFIGRRIVPKHDGVWDINKEYEELSIVLDKASGESYISRRPVPVGTAISDEIYWMQYSLYSAQIAEAVKEMEDTEARLIQYVDTAESNMNSRVNSAESLTNSNKAELNSRIFRFHMEAAGFKYILPCPQLKAINQVLHFMMQIRNLSAEAITIGKLRNWHFAEFSAQMELLIYA